MLNWFRPVIIIITLACAGSAATSADLQKGLMAANAGDFATALKELRPLAERGGDEAQYSLGLIYANGSGVPEDSAEAARWYRLAAE